MEVKIESLRVYWYFLGYIQFGSHILEGQHAIWQCND